MKRINMDLKEWLDIIKLSRLVQGTKQRIHLTRLWILLDLKLS